MSNIMKQCLLTHGTSVMTLWIPQQHAKTGKHISFKEDNVERFWVVDTVYPVSTMTEKEQNERGRDYKNHAKATDIRRGSFERLCGDN